VRRREDALGELLPPSQEVLYARRPCSPRWVFSPRSQGGSRPGSAKPEARKAAKGRPTSAPLRPAVAVGSPVVAGGFGRAEALAAGVMKDAFYQSSGLDNSHGVKQCLLFPEMRSLGLRRCSVR